MSESAAESPISSTVQLLTQYQAGQRNFSAAELRRAQLMNANLRGVDLSYADLRGANLQSAQLRGADLSYAVLEQANLEAADLRGALLIGTSFRQANLKDICLEGADFDASTLFPEGYTP